MKEVTIKEGAPECIHIAAMIDNLSDDMRLELGHCYNYFERENKHGRTEYRECVCNIKDLFSRMERGANDRKNNMY